jgi:hypothetical protein
VDPHAPTGPAPTIFLGALASEVNEPDELPAAFADVARATERVVGAIRAGVVSTAEGAEHLSRLRVTDASGVVWSVGATSLRWYRKTPGRGWKLAAPPSVADEQAVASSAAALEMVPAHLIADPQAPAPATGYGVDAVVDTPVTGPAAWEFEPGEDRFVTRAPGWDQVSPQV